MRRIEFVFRSLGDGFVPLKMGVYISQQIKGQMSEGALEGSLAWDNGAWDGSVSLADAQAEQVVRSVGWDIPLYGAVDITAQYFRWSKRANGTASMDEGRIVKWDFLQRLLHPMAQWGLIACR